MSLLRYTVIGLIIAAVPVLYALDRGILLGSTNTVFESTNIPGEKGEVVLVHKRCRYLFITGIAEKPAPGGLFGTGPLEGGVQPLNQADKLYCPFFGE